MTSAFRAESRSVRRFVGLPSIEKVALWPTIDAILAKFRGEHQEIGDHIVLGAFNDALTGEIRAGHYGDVYDAIGQAMGLHDQDGKLTDAGARRFQLGKSLTSEEVAAKKPPSGIAREIESRETRRRA